MNIDDISVSAFFVADHAETINGKLYIHGGYWNRLAFPEYPATAPGMALVVVLRIPFRDPQQPHQFSIGLIDSDGVRLPFKVDGDFMIGSSPQTRRGDPTLLPLAIPVQGLDIERPGDYSFVVDVDGIELARYQISADQSDLVVPEDS